MYKRGGGGIYRKNFKRGGHEPAVPPLNPPLFLCDYNILGQIRYRVFTKL